MKLTKEQRNAIQKQFELVKVSDRSYEVYAFDPAGGPSTSSHSMSYGDALRHRRDVRAVEGAKQILENLGFRVTDYVQSSMMVDIQDDPNREGTWFALAKELAREYIDEVLEEVSDSGEVGNEDWLRAMIFKHDMTRQDFAEMMGVKRSTVHNWLNPKTNSRYRRMSDHYVKLLKHELGET